MNTTTQKSKRKRRNTKKTIIEKVDFVRISASRPGSFMIRLRRDGLNICETFPTLEHARARAAQIVKERTRHGVEAFSLGPQERQDAKSARDLLSGRVSLEAAARFWLLHHPDRGGVSLGELIDLYVEELERRKLRPLSIKSAERRVRRFAVDYGNRPAIAITPADVEQWLDVRGGPPVNRNNYQTGIRALFGWALKKGYATSNPAADIDRAKVDANIPTTWSADRVEALLRAARVFREEMVPALAILAFAGLRPFEALRLDWQNINLDERHIRIMPATSKIRRARLVDIPDNLVEWLLPYRQHQGPVAPAQITFTRWRTRLAAAAVLGVDKVGSRLEKVGPKKARQEWRQITKDATKAAGGELWPADILRHTCATMHLAQHADIMRLSEALGNSPKVIKSSYQGLATANEAAKFWSISPTPAAAGKLIRLAS